MDSTEEMRAILAEVRAKYKVILQACPGIERAANDAAASAARAEDAAASIQEILESMASAMEG